MQRTVRAAMVFLAASGLGMLALSLTACPSLADIGVGSPEAGSADRGADTLGTPDASSDARSEARAPDADASPPCRAEVGTDPANCGSCGHDCLGGSCSDGLCQAVLVYSGDTPTSLVVDGPNLFVTADVAATPDDGYVFRCTATDCQGTKEVLSTDLANPWFATVDGTTLLWVNGGSQDGGASGSIEGCPTGDCPDAGPTDYTPSVVDGGDAGAPLLSFAGLAFDSTYLYWAQFNATGVESGGINRCAVSACADTVVSLVAGETFIPLTVAVTSTYVYWTDLGTDQVLRCQLPSCGGNPEIFANDQPSAQGLTLYEGTVYWTQGVDPGSVLSCPTSGCGAGPTTVASNQRNPFGIAVDDTGIYWTNIDDGTVMHCAPGGCTKSSPPVQIAAAPAAYAIALDAVSVYFTSSTVAGSVWRVAK